jgi:hypothetical protein
MIDNTHKGDLFAWFSLAIIMWPASVALPMTICATPPPERILLVQEARESCTFNRVRPPKPRCESSCRGLRGTGVVNSQCHERFPRGTGPHPVIFMTSIRKERCGWWPFKSPLLVVSLWRPNRKTTCPKNLKRRGTPLQGDPYEKFFSRGQEAPVHR